MECLWTKRAKPKLKSTSGLPQASGAGRRCAAFAPKGEFRRFPAGETAYHCIGYSCKYQWIFIKLSQKLRAAPAACRYWEIPPGVLQYKKYLSEPQGQGEVRKHEIRHRRSAGFTIMYFGYWTPSLWGHCRFLPNSHFIASRWRKKRGSHQQGFFMYFKCSLSFSKSPVNSYSCKSSFVKQ